MPWVGHFREKTQRNQRERSPVVPVEGIEPPLLAEHDFESCASTSSATRALGAFYSEPNPGRQKEIRLCPPLPPAREARVRQRLPACPVGEGRTRTGRVKVSAL
jgi:hypothetical protein